MNLIKIFKVIPFHMIGGFMFGFAIPHGTQTLFPVRFWLMIFGLTLFVFHFYINFSKKYRHV